LLQDLNANGIQDHDITDVFLTHLHFDHCGGAISFNENQQLVTTFPNATYWSNQDHWNWAINPNPREKASFLTENILPIQESGQLKMIPLEQNIEFFPDIKIFFAYGHTEAMMIPQIKYKGHSICYMADLLPSVAHLPMPYVMAYDMRPLVTMQEKANFLKNAVNEYGVLFFEHDPINECCSLIQNEKGIVADKIFALDSL
jgi:glyoxylase-like metal-dependent hydrolase (beta-lactamase superfamily II)